MSSISILEKRASSFSHYFEHNKDNINQFNANKRENKPSQAIIKHIPSQKGLSRHGMALHASQSQRDQADDHNCVEYNSAEYSRMRGIEGHNVQTGQRTFMAAFKGI